jgi:hypothetical protein
VAVTVCVRVTTRAVGATVGKDDTLEESLASDRMEEEEVSGEVDGGSS